MTSAARYWISSQIRDDCEILAHRFAPILPKKSAVQLFEVEQAVVPQPRIICPATTLRPSFTSRSRNGFGVHRQMSRQ
jgi:hypothetical protein